ncbi:MAG TPA: transglycosylase family protein [Acidimicrobiales bacterium]|nr:transglycosylase family protein [Acidimicrobiales bacterium]
MRTHRTMALAATLSLAAVAAMTDMPSGTLAAHADVAASRPRPSTGGAALAALRSCESGGDYTSDTGNGYYGAYQFSVDTWRGLGYAGYPSEAAAATQDEAVVRLYRSSGWSSWPGCAASLDLASMPAPSITAPAPAATVAVPVVEPDPASPSPPEERPHPRLFQDLVAEFG